MDNDLNLKVLFIAWSRAILALPIHSLSWTSLCLGLNEGMLEEKQETEGASPYRRNWEKTGHIQKIPEDPSWINAKLLCSQDTKTFSLKEEASQYGCSGHGILHSPGRTGGGGQPSEKQCFRHRREFSVPQNEEHEMVAWFQCALELEKRAPWNEKGLRMGPKSVSVAVGSQEVDCLKRC